MAKKKSKKTLKVRLRLILKKSFRKAYLRIFKRPFNMHNMKVGFWGERQACKYLKKQGYYITKRNFWSYYGEIDIIAETKHKLIFIEVKTRKENPLFRPAAAVNKHKRENIFKTATVYLKRRNPKRKIIRFDIIEVYYKDKKKLVSINHIKNAFKREGKHGPF